MTFWLFMGLTLLGIVTLVGLYVIGYCFIYGATYLIRQVEHLFR